MRIEGVAHVEQGLRGGHELHEALSAFGGDGAGVEGGFLAGDFADQFRVNVVFAGCCADHLRQFGERHGSAAGA